MGLILDTHILVWLAAGDARLSIAARDAIVDRQADLFLSSVTSWKFADLQHRGRIPMIERIEAIADMLDLKLLELPAELWRRAEALPDIHGDPVDRMLIAHTIEAGLTLVTADRTMRRYPVPTLW